jgi:hypothetical protein
VPLDTGNPSADAANDFLRARRRRALSRLAARLRGEPGDVNVILPFEEVVDALGFLGQKRLGLRRVRLDGIVGTVDRTRDFDRQFRPTSSRVRTRWERINTAQRRGQAMPPVSLLKIGELHFVRDGHHRVSVARALGHPDIEADVTEVYTRVGASRPLRIADLPMKSHERLFHERVPLTPEARARISLTDPWRYAILAEGVEAWGFRASQSRGEALDRSAVARTWFDEEYAPVVAMLREAGLIGKGTEADAYMRVAGVRYRLLRTHEWSEDVLSRLREAERTRQP